MNMIVLMKLAADPDRGHMTEEGIVDREKSGLITNPYDLNALEEALKAKAKHGGSITVLSMGPSTPAQENLLRDALARGADQAVLLTDRKLAASDTRATAYALSRAIRKIGAFDLVFAGMQAVDGDTAQVGPQVAENLNIPQITFCEQVEIDGDAVIARRVIEGGYERIKASLPALLTMTNAANDPKLPTLRGILRAKGAEITAWSAQDVGAEEGKIGLRGSPTKVKKVQWIERREGGCKFAKGGTTVERVLDLLTKLRDDGIDLSKRAA